jgi:hypothetical protein
MPLDRVLDLFLAFLGGGSLAALVSLYRAKAQNGLDQAQAWKTLLEQMQNRILNQQIEIDDLKIEILEKSGYIEKLARLLMRASIEVPTYTIRHRTKDKE